MPSTRRRAVPSPTPSSSTSGPVVASGGGLQLRWHARALRGDRTLAEASRLVHLNRDELARIERGETTQIRFETLVKLLAGYGCSLSDLLVVERAPGEDGAAPLYSRVLAAIEDGRLESRSPTHRAVRRPVEADRVSDADDADFAVSPTTRSPRRRSAMGTLNQAE